MFSQNDKMMSVIIKQIAIQEGLSTTEVRQNMELAIEDARNSPDPEAQTNFKKIFGSRTPTPEEFVGKIVKQLLKR